MYMFVVSLHVCLCVFMVLIILLQPAKGSDIGAAFGGGGGGGGGGSSLFGPRGPSGLLQKATTLVAILFMCTSLSLAIYSNRSLVSDGNVEEELIRIQTEEARQAAEAAAAAEEAANTAVETEAAPVTDEPAAP
jgi:preprotein translocase subunit SecG